MDAAEPSGKSDIESVSVDAPGEAETIELKTVHRPPPIAPIDHEVTVRQTRPPPRSWTYVIGRALASVFLAVAGAGGFLMAAWLLMRDIH
jgi:hypothetical protein